MSRATGRFGRSERLRRSGEFRHVSGRGMRSASSNFILLVAPAVRDTGREYAVQRRLGITVSRKVGNAVVRNRVKRQIREWYRGTGRELQGLVRSDVVVIARPGARQLAGPVIGCELTELAQNSEARP